MSGSPGMPSGADAPRPAGVRLGDVPAVEVGTACKVAHNAECALEDMRLLGAVVRLALEGSRQPLAGPDRHGVPRLAAARREPEEVHAGGEDQRLADALFGAAQTQEFLRSVPIGRRPHQGHRDRHTGVGLEFDEYEAPVELPLGDLPDEEVLVGLGEVADQAA